MTDVFVGSIGTEESVPGPQFPLLLDVGSTESDEGVPGPDFPLLLDVGSASDGAVGAPGFDQDIFVGSVLSEESVPGLSVPFEQFIDVDGVHDAPNVPGVNVVSIPIPEPPPPPGEPIPASEYPPIPPVTSNVVLPQDVWFPIADMGGAWGHEWQDVMNDAGAGAVLMSRHDPEVKKIPLFSLVRFNLEGNVASQFYVEDIADDVIMEGEESEEVVRISGRGPLAMWEPFVVHPANGFGSKPLSDNRSFGWMQPNFSDVTWIRPYQMFPQSSLHKPPAGFNHAPPDWDSLGGASDVQWIWSRPKPPPLGIGVFDPHPEGTSYFRAEVTIINPANVRMLLSSFGNVRVYLDGALLFEDWSGAYKTIYNAGRVDFPMTPGNHVFAFECEAIWPPNPATTGWLGGLLFQLQRDTHIEDNAAFYSTNSSATTWRALDYPSSIPGITVGRAIRELLEEAQARSFLWPGVLDYWTLGFSDSHDSAGQAWPTTQGLTLDIGTDYLSVLRQLAEVYCDIAPSAWALQLNAWRKGTRGDEVSAEFTKGHNIISMINHLSTQ